LPELDTTPRQHAAIVPEAWIASREGATRGPTLLWRRTYPLATRSPTGLREPQPVFPEPQRVAYQSCCLREVRFSCEGHWDRYRKCEDIGEDDGSRAGRKPITLWRTDSYMVPVLGHLAVRYASSASSSVGLGGTRDSTEAGNLMEERIKYR
jgi:hypothetical protein